MQTVLTAASLRLADRDAADYVSRGASTTATKGVPSLDAVRAMAARQSSGLEAAKRLRTMARVASDLQGQIIALVAISLSVVGGCVFFAIVFPTLADRPWLYTEFVLLYPVWAMLVPMTAGFILFAFNAVGELKQTQVGDVEWCPAKPVPIAVHVRPRRPANRHWDTEADLEAGEEEDASTEGDLMPTRSRDEESGGSSGGGGLEKDETSLRGD